MSPRPKPRGAWADDALVTLRTGHPVEVRFRGVPVGHGETLTVTVRPGWNEAGEVVLLGFDLDRPLTARRMKGLPLDALRRECAALLRDAGVTPMVTGRKPGRTAAARLTALAESDRSSDAFLSVVAQVCREARADGGSGWQAVAEAVGVARAQAQRYIAAAREGHDVGTLDRMAGHASVPVEVTDSTAAGRTVRPAQRKGK